MVADTGYSSGQTAAGDDGITSTLSGWATPTHNVPGGELRRQRGQQAAKLLSVCMEREGSRSGCYLRKTSIVSARHACCNGTAGRVG